MTPNDIYRGLKILDAQNKEPQRIEVSRDVMKSLRSTPYPQMNGFTSSDCSEFYGFKLIENPDLPENTVKFLNPRGESMI